jgi:hypothetical protein
MNCLNAIIRRERTEIESSGNLSDPANNSSCEPSKVMPFLSGDSLGTEMMDRPASSVVCSETKVDTAAQSSYARRTESLITSGLGERHYTHIDAKKIRSTNPGFCFLAAGWVRLKTRTKKLGLRILERKGENHVKSSNAG